MKAIICLIFAVYCCNLVYGEPGIRGRYLPNLNEVLVANTDSTAMAKGEDSARVKEINMDIVAVDGVKLKATYYTPGKPGPGMLLLHQCNMDRRSWKALATGLAQRGIHVLTFDYRGYGETPRVGGNENLSADIDAALAALLAQPGVDRLNIGAGGASCGVSNAVQLASRNGKIKALMLLSGPVSGDGLTYLRNHPGLPIFGAASSEEDFAVKAIREMVNTSTNPASIMKVPQNAGYGAPMFTADPTLMQAVTDWIEKVLK